MSFSITNIASLNAITNLTNNTTQMNKSLMRLSSGLRINSAADDSSGMAIADSLRSQTNALNQAIRNANDGKAMLTIADKGMDEQLKILDEIKVKATQAASDTQNAKSRKAIASDIKRLLEQLDNIATQTSYNGISLLSGSFTNKEFQVGAYSNQTIGVSIASTMSSKIGHVRKESSAQVETEGVTQLTFKNPTGGSDIKLESVVISTGAGTGLGVLSEVINKNSDKLGVRAEASVVSTGTSPISAGSVSALYINGIEIGDVTFDDNDRTGSLRNAINSYEHLTGIKASLDTAGRLNLTSNDGRGIKISSALGGDSMMLGAISAGAIENYGRLSLTSHGANDIRYSATNNLASLINGNGAEMTVNLRDTTGSYTKETMDANGSFPNDVFLGDAANLLAGSVTSKEGAMLVMDIAQAAIIDLDRTRADIGSVSVQLDATINNLSVTAVNIKAAESAIRDVDFAKESSNFTKQNILVQSGSFALSQANATQQMILRLLNF